MWDDEFSLKMFQMNLIQYVGEIKKNLIKHANMVILLRFHVFEKCQQN